jgi:hypothetical protein
MTDARLDYFSRCYHPVIDGGHQADGALSSVLTPPLRTRDQHRGQFIGDGDLIATRENTKGKGNANEQGAVGSCDTGRSVGGLGRAADEAHGGELARQDREIVVWDDGADAQRTGPSVHPVVDEIHRAGVRGLLLAGERDFDSVGGVPRARALSLGPEPAVLHVVGFGRVEVDVDRVQRHDGSEKGRSAIAAVHQVSDADEMASDASGDGRGDLREFDVEQRTLQGAFGLLGSRLALLQLLPALVYDVFRHGLGGDQLRRAGVFEFGELGPRLRVGQLSAGLFGGRLERAGIDDVEGAPFFTMAPSWNSMLSMEPPTRARTCTWSTASNRPVDSSRSVTFLCTGSVTTTEGASSATGSLDRRSRTAATRVAAYIAGVLAKGEVAMRSVATKSGTIARPTSCWGRFGELR